MRVVTDVEHELESLIEHIRTILTKDPNAHIQINPPKTPVITVGGKVHTNTAEPTNGHPH